MGIGTIVVLMFIRLTGETPAQIAPALPDRITLPEGQTAIAVTMGAGRISSRPLPDVPLDAVDQ